MTNNYSNITYLDYNATAPMRPEAVRIMSEILLVPHNASSVHTLGRAAHKIIEDSREKISALVNCPPGQIIFNSGATEGNNTILKYFSHERVLVSAIEHPSVLEAAPGAEKIPVTQDGRADLNALEKLLQEKKTALISVMMVNNETGTIQPMAKISALAKRYGALLHCDAVQAAGRIPIDMPAGFIDFLTLSAHKIGGPQGVGALCLGLCGITPTLIDGGGQEKKARAGTQNIAGIAGFAAAAECALRDLGQSSPPAILPSPLNTRTNPPLNKLQNNLEIALCKINTGGKNDIVIHSASAPRVANTTSFSVPGAASETLLMAFDLEGIALSNGSACSSGSVKSSHVLNAMNVPPALASSVIRVSTGWATTESDIEKFLAAWEKISKRINKK